MVESIEEMEDVIVPHSGYQDGWNVILYNNNTHRLDSVVGAFMNSGYFDEQVAVQLAIVASRKGYIAVPFSVDKKAANNVLNSFRKIGLQCELIHSDGIKPIKYKTKQ